MRAECSIDGCTEVVKAKGWCQRHYDKARNNGGDPLGGRGPRKPPKPPHVSAPLTYFNAHVMLVTPECIIWPFASNWGYGIVTIDGRPRRVHVVSCEIHHGPMPAPGMEAGHGPCHERACFNGAHVSWKTRLGNSADRRRDGTLTVGEAHVAAKLTDAAVLAIRARSAMGEGPVSLGRAFGVCTSNIRAITTGNTWKHLLPMSKGM